MATYPSFRGSALERALPPEGQLIVDPEEQVYTMRQVENAVAEVGLPQIRYGMRGYGAVTKNVYATVDRFEYPEKIEDTLPNFAEKAYTEFRHHVHGNRDKIPHSWQSLMYGRLARNLHPAMAMAAFWEGHIGYHLPQSLRDTDTQPKHRGDYNSVNDILTNTSAEIIEDYLRMWPWLGSAGTRIGKTGEGQSLKRIYKVRDLAFDLGQLLIANKDDPEKAKRLLEDADTRAARGIFISKTVGNVSIRAFSGVPHGAWQRHEAA